MYNMIRLGGNAIIVTHYPRSDYPFYLEALISFFRALIHTITYTLSTNHSLSVFAVASLEIEVY